MSAVRVFHLTARALTVQRWSRGEPIEAFAFDSDEDGMELFSRYLHAAPDEPALLLVDRVEEEFVVERVPHAFGGERRQLHARRAERLFGATPLRSAARLGREREGRRDDRVLFSALTHPEGVLPWIGRMGDAAIPLHAISSVPHVSAGLPRALGLQSGDLLFVTADANGLRQTFFQAGEMRVSRLAPGCTGPEGVVQEIARTRRYLQSAFQHQEASLAVYVVGDEPLLGGLETTAIPDGLQLRLCRPEDVAERLGIRWSPSVGISSVFAALFLRHPDNHYAEAACLRGSTLHRARQALALGSLAAALVLCALAMVAATAALADRRATAALRAAHARETTLVAAHRSAPLPDGLSPEQLRRRVEEGERIVRIAMRPEPALAPVGRLLALQPELRLRRIEWAASLDPGLSDVPAMAAFSAAAAPEGAAISERPFHHLVIDGRVAPPDGSPSAALRSVERFAAALHRTPGVLSIAVLSKPVDPDGPIRGSAGRRDAAPEGFPFSLQVVLRP